MDITSSTPFSTAASRNPLRIQPSIQFSPRWKTTRPLRVALVRPPSIVSRYAVAAPLTPPLGLAYLAATVREAGHQVQVVDGVGEGLRKPRLWKQSTLLRGLTFEEIAGRIQPEPDVIGISCMFSSEWPFAHQLIRVLKQAWPGSLLVGGGEHFNAVPEQSLESCPELTACVMGEGEETFLEFLERVSSSTPLEEVAGLAYRSREGSIKRNGPRGRIRNVDDIPWPAWDLIPLESYLDLELGLATLHGRSMPMLATRGCPFQCAFCSNVYMWTPLWIPRNPVMVLDEFELYMKRYRVNDIQFFDPNTIIDKKWILTFADEITRRDLKISWQIPIGTRPETVDREVARALARSGCFTMGFAPESGSSRTLKRINKTISIPHMKRSIRNCLEEGLKVKCNIMLGFPGETHRDVWQTLKLILEMSRLGVHDTSVYPFSPYPGTPLFEQLRDEGRLPGIYTDPWYLSLNYVEFSSIQSCSEHFNRQMLRIYQFLGYALFYGTTFLFRPIRIYRLIRGLITGRHETKGETILDLFFRRLMLKTIPTLFSNRHSVRTIFGYLFRWLMHK